ncbi:hypothetical protein GCM10027280_14300 [Micromonospora polyrhachis]|uniref:Guanylate cyclase domain-containing protein n=1 Tax=Micromonospora polyrhachis TaxID=1282883 RepID=A0A7W7WPM0_9ACTN|nr:hypothetical protein [Micromonospora polyrhachis]MBB4958682.1 hypothetical protein [Micromonospora polyrhachis]
MNQLRPFEHSRPLPPYRAVLAVDAKGFTKLPGSTHEDVAILIPQLVGEAMRSAGLEAEWSSPDFFGHTGDGFAVGLPTRVLPYLIHPFPALLQERLDEHRRSHPGEQILRLRVSLHVGPLPVDPSAAGNGGNGVARNETHRLLDSDVVKQVLTEASPNVTLVVVIVSDRVFHDVVAAGYAGLHPDHFVDVLARVSGKAFAQRAWLHLPAPSGPGPVRVGADTDGRDAPDHEVVPAPPPSAAHPTGLNYGQTVTGGAVHGGMHQQFGGQQ